MTKRELTEEQKERYRISRKKRAADRKSRAAREAAEKAFNRERMSLLNRKNYLVHKGEDISELQQLLDEQMSKRESIVVKQYNQIMNPNNQYNDTHDESPPPPVEPPLVNLPRTHFTPLSEADQARMAQEQEQGLQLALAVNQGLSEDNQKIHADNQTIEANSRRRCEIYASYMARSKEYQRRLYGREHLEQPDQGMPPTSLVAFGPAFAALAPPARPPSQGETSASSARPHTSGSVSFSGLVPPVATPGLPPKPPASAKRSASAKGPASKTRASSKKRGASAKGPASKTRASSKKRGASAKGPAPTPATKRSASYKSRAEIAKDSAVLSPVLSSGTSIKDNVDNLEDSKMPDISPSSMDPKCFSVASGMENFPSKSARVKAKAKTNNDPEEVDSEEEE